MDLNKITTNNQAEEIILNYLKKSNLNNFIEKCKDTDFKKLFRFLTEQARENNMSCADENTVFSWCDEYFINYEERERKIKEREEEVKKQIEKVEEVKITEKPKKVEILSLF